MLKKKTKNYISHMDECHSNNQFFKCHDCLHINNNNYNTTCLIIF